ncbi:hypothetical protein F4861DRAFT_540703 [Xylaria intraflava]|nr:hypothetical protein F4861DRAFT_540703 [Xylaria intraflava]
MGSSGEDSGAEKSEEDQECQRLVIVVLRGDPIDAPQYRHTALFIEHLNRSGRTMRHRLIRAIGSTGMFERDETTDHDPVRNVTFAGSVTVATIAVTGESDTRLRDTIWSTPVNNVEYDWGCQHWVGDALIRAAKWLLQFKVLGLEAGKLPVEDSEYATVAKKSSGERLRTPTTGPEQEVVPLDFIGLRPALGDQAARVNGRAPAKATDV